MLITTFVFASADKPLKVHSENLECANCHETNEPVSRASYKKCVECHGDMKTAEKSTFHDEGGAVFTMNPHNSHAGNMRCTLCHSSHAESVVYCNTCHHNFDMKVP